MAGGLSELIVLATNSPAKRVEEAPLKEIKALVRSSDENVKAAAELLMDRLGKNHSQIRYLTLLIIDELFMRSKLFRGHLVAVFENFLLLCLGYRAEKPLPAPADRAALLKSKALEIVERWNETFGPHYKQLQLGYEYLKFTLNFKFPGIREAATRAEEERNAREKRTQDLLRCRLLQLVENFSGLKKDLMSTIGQLEECFAILSEEDNLGGNVETLEPEEMETEAFGIQSLRQWRAQQESQVWESRDNEAIFDMARDLLKLVITRHLPATQEWLSVLMRVDLENRQSRDDMLKEVIDMRNRLLGLKDKCDELGIEVVKPRPDTEGDIEWEEEQVFDRSKLRDEQLKKPEQTRGVESTSSAPLASEKTTRATSSDLKKKLLEEAPVLAWGSFLDAWGSEAAVPANMRGMVFDNHWGRVDPDALISSDKMAAMQVRASYYEPQKTDIRPCLAPLRSGGLCQRRDLRKCPLHGPVLPRDEQGNPLEKKIEGNLPEKKVEGVGVSTVAVAAQAVKNVRERDEAERRKKKKNQARTDREHNEAVLRSAALARDVSSMVENMDGSEASSSKRRRQGLNAMLRKKEAPRDRIAKRLLRGRAVDATVASIARAEDDKYRESFPNQW